mgnify:CR=1 FL=1|tara:strand:+ start:8266 stop:8931 length:666 start_codon:yes stop_codon:yes gene_type:complete
MNDLTLIIPAKNESESLPEVISELEKFNLNLNVVLHESDIDTIKSIEQPNVKIVYQKNFGYGDALIEGIKNCKTEYFCIFNADGSFRPEEIEAMKKSIDQNNLDFVFGSRYQSNSGSEDDTMVTLVGNYFFTFLGNLMFRLNITDILYTFVLGKTELAKKLDLSQKDFTICVELPIKAKKNDMRIGSSSCYERKRIAGKKKVKAFKDGLLILIHMFRLYFK